MSKAGVVERAWATRLTLPVNGPALSLFPLWLIAKGAWKKTPALLSVSTLDEAVEDPDVDLATLYWHVLDHGRNNGSWAPPLPALA